MGKIIASVSCSLDGIFTGPQGDENNMVSWAMPGVIDAMSDNLVMFQQAEALLMGRITYEGFSTYWPFQEGDWADAMNKTSKYVVTRNQDCDIQWGDYKDTITLLSGDMEAKLKGLKKELNGDIIVPASASLVQSLLGIGLIDEFSMIVHPVIVGSGNSYLKNITSRKDLKLLRTQHYETSGSIRLCYEVMK